ncbi:MAG TPA: OB-fold nucleic acid binding domain-containing protein [Bryobacteraceae bacterium]|jgi:3'-5' exoribonuclease|nr:OB-fold nucleic acid binding domain-containing protein [Bryobacteraceae bacterium]
MKSPFIRELKPNETATAVFLVHSKEIRQKRSGEPYLSLLLGDRSGEIDAKMWDNVAEVMDSFDRDNFIKVKGLMQLYNNRSQLTIHKLRRVEDSEVDFRDFFPASQRDPEEMWRELRAIVTGIGNEPIRLLLNAFLDDPDIAARYRIAPAAKTIHHAFRSGLLEHVLSLCSLAKVTGAHYANVDCDLLLAGCVLHDIGKIYELTYERGFGYSAEGQLLGHITIAIRMMEEKLRAFPRFPAQLRNLLEHMILSHHGQLDFGSPKVPVFPEALLLHYLDDMDSKMECMRALIEKDPHADTEFTAYSSSLARVALRKERYLGPELCPPSAGASSASADTTSTTDANNPATDPELVVHSPKSGSADDFDAVTRTVAPPANSIFGAKLQQALHPVERT